MKYQNPALQMKYHLVPELGHRLLKELTLNDIENVAKILKMKKPLTKSYQAIRKNLDEEFFEDDDFLSSAYRREILTVACMVTKFGTERGLLVQNPFQKFKLPETLEQPYDYWRIDEEDAFLTWLENGGVFHRKVAKAGSVKKGAPMYYSREFRMRPGKAEDLYDITLLALRSGLRKGEIGALRSCDVNFEKNCIIVRRSYSEKEKRIKKTTKGKTYRFVEMNDDIRDILKRRIAKVQSKDQVLFKTSSWAVKNFSKYCEKAGVRTIHFHSLRHTCLTNLANGYGMDAPLPLPQVQKIAGHRDISTTMRYVHTDGIENTSSKQWSRSKRMSIADEKEDNKVSGVRFLRIVKN